MVPPPPVVVDDVLAQSSTPTCALARGCSIPDEGLRRIRIAEIGWYRLRYEGLPNATTRGDAYESMGGSDPPRTPMLRRTTNTTGHQNAVQKHKSVPRFAQITASKAQKVVALPDPAAQGQAMTPPSHKARLRGHESSKIPPPVLGSSAPTLATPRKVRGELRRDDAIAPLTHRLEHRVDQLDG